MSYLREALHVIDNEIVSLPYKASSEEISKYKKLEMPELEEYIQKYTTARYKGFPK